jgi:hypothetical protein
MYDIIMIFQDTIRPINWMLDNLYRKGAPSARSRPLRQTCLENCANHTIIK